MADVLLPEAAITILPFSAEPIRCWRGKTDIRRFVDALYATSSYPPFSSYLYKREKKDMWAWSKRFIQGAKDPLQEELKEQVKEHIATQAGNIPNFLEDAGFGKAAKYVVAWKSCVQSLLEESGFYSLAHILEADEEIDCSLLLASHLYYKQAVQVLRNFIEENILPIHFCENVHEFNLWKANSYRIPPLRGRDGLVKKLVDKRIISEAIGDVVSGLYGDLNGYIHGSENKLIHKGVHTGSRNGRLFKRADFEAWCDYLARSVDLGIRLLRINYIQWEKISSLKWESLRTQGRVLCFSCHNDSEFDIEPVPADIEEVLLPDGTWSTAAAASLTLTRYICRQCGSSITVPTT